MLSSIRKCAASGCNLPAIARDLCATHYKRMARHGHTEQTRPADWGSRQKHPLFKYWVSLFRRRATIQVCAGWKDFWTFVKDVGECPNRRHRLERIDASKPHGPDNCYWQLHESGGTPDQKEERAAYQKRWWQANHEHVRNQDMLKRYGIGVSDYDRMHTEQEGLCAVCLEPERETDSRIKKTRRLSVDHCHSRGHIRGLLCAKCNQGLGSFRDRIDLLESAIAYLKRHSPIT